MRIKENYVLSEMSDCYMVVAVGPATKEFSGIIRLNDAGAFLWKELEKGASEADLIDALLREYPDADQDQVGEDVKEFLQTIPMAIDP